MSPWCVPSFASWPWSRIVEQSSSLAHLFGYLPLAVHGASSREEAGGSPELLVAPWAASELNNTTYCSGQQSSCHQHLPLRAGHLPCCLLGTVMHQPTASPLSPCGSAGHSQGQATGSEQASEGRGEWLCSTLPGCSSADPVQATGEQRGHPTLILQWASSGCCCGRVCLDTPSVRPPPAPNSPNTKAAPAP